MRFALCLGLLSGALLWSTGARAQPLEPGNYFRTLTFEGRERAYRFRVPAGYDGSAPVPLVLDLHGAGSTAFAQAFISGYAELADSEGFVVAQPDGFGNTWNGGTCCGESVALGLDSIGFLKKVAGLINDELEVDASRIYATGLSNGGAMSHRLACDAADFVAAVAPVAFGVPFLPFSGCMPSRPISVHMTMGLTDTVVSYAIAVPSFEYWREVNGCAGGAPDLVVHGNEGICETYSDCDDGVDVSLCSVVGDDFAGTPLEDLAGHVPYANDDFDIALEGWTQMSQYVTDPPPVLVPEPAVPHGQVSALLCVVAAVRRAGHRRDRRAVSSIPRTVPPDSPLDSPRQPGRECVA